MQSLRILLLLGATSLALTACDFLKKDDGNGADGAPAAEGQSGDAPQAPPALPVTVAKPLTREVEEFREFSGRFEAINTVEIRSRVSGYLNQVQFTDGAIVKKGDNLFVIDPRPFEATLRQREADRAVASSQVTTAENDFQRADTLFKSGDVSAALLDQRRAARDAAKAQVASAQAAVDAARLDLTYTRITAPVTGRISRYLVSPGNLVNQGQDVLTTIVSLDPIYFYFDVDEQTYVDYARRTSSDAPTDIPVAVGLGDETDFPHAGRVDFIDNAISAQTGTMRGRAVLDNPSNVLTPGMFGRARFRTSGAATGILIPDEAIITDQSRKLVYVVNDRNVVETRTIEPGQMDKGLRVIKKGLQGDEWVIINGLQRAREGGTVAPQQSSIKSQEASGTLTTPSVSQAEHTPEEISKCEKAEPTDPKTLTAPGGMGGSEEQQAPDEGEAPADGEQQQQDEASKDAAQ